MKKQLFSFLFLVTLVFQTSAQTADQSQTEKNLRKHVSYLTSDQLEGRRTGERGATSAAGYVTNMFTRYKLKGGVKNLQHGKDHPSFLQGFPYIAGVELGKENLLEITDSKNLSKAAIKKEWAPLGFTPNTSLPYTKVVFAGYGITSEKLKYDDYKGIDAKDKIVLAFDGNPDSDNPHSFFGFFNSHAKAKIAMEKGAKALILISKTDNFSEDKLAMRFNQTLGETAIPTIVISRQLAAKILKEDISVLKSHEKMLATVAKGQSGAGRRIKTQGKNLLANLKINLEKKKVAAYNVIGVLEGNDPKLKNEIIVVGAHYDHLGRGGSGSLAVNSKEIHHGADDNASGTSALVELARQFSEAKSNKRTIIFMAFGGEEEGLLGSKFWVNNPTIPLKNIVAMVNMDMVGRLTNKKLTVGGIGTASEWNKIVNENQPYPFGETLIGIKADKAVKEGTHTPVSVSINGDIAAAKSVDNKVFKLQLNQDGFGPSDHSSFYGKKIPVLFFFTGAHVDYHKPSDTAEKINYKGLENITKFVSKIVKSVDRNPKRPTYTVAKSSGMSGGRRGFSVSLGTVPSYANGNNDGLVLDGVRDNSPASKAGVKAGDKIIKLADKEIRNISDYVFVLGEMRPDKEYEIVVMRGKQKLALKITPKKR